MRHTSKFYIPLTQWLAFVFNAIGYYKLTISRKLSQHVDFVTIYIINIVTLFLFRQNMWYMLETPVILCDMFISSAWHRY